ncbi:uncharacterized protein LOC123675785 isoform X2 [Harmonia axyridis]|uniref:uncharacterized protein LOC123675785 isoform X2 n=1 Tax=Harmonia axyridis TaxID=115357 RepID=UPI001E277FB6|nr:uncharacterized protein LOC123675785 isoform X2 [Harmonia axyridis]
MLSPMINKEHMEQIKEKLTNDNVKSVMSLPKNSSNNENMKIQAGSSTSPHRMSNTIINGSQSQKDSELEYSESTIASGNFIDGDFPDMQPSRETTINSATPREFKFIEITSVESPVQSSLDDTQNTTQTENEEKEKLTIQEYDEVIDDNESGSDSIGSGILTPASSFIKRTMANNSMKHEGRRHSILKNNRRRLT